jgi:hypothetical protein
MAVIRGPLPPSRCYITALVAGICRHWPEPFARRRAILLNRSEYTPQGAGDRRQAPREIRRAKPRFASVEIILHLSRMLGARADASTSFPVDQWVERVRTLRRGYEATDARSPRWSLRLRNHPPRTSGAFLYRAGRTRTCNPGFGDKGTMCGFPA